MESVRFIMALCGLLILCLHPSLDLQAQQSTLKQWDVVDGEKGIGIVADWPALPPRFEIPDYELLAESYEKMAFADQDDRTNRLAWGISRNFRGLSILQPPFLLFNWWQNKCFNRPSDCNPKGPNYVSQSTVLFPGLLSSAVMGSDMTALAKKTAPAFSPQNPKNLVRMMKAYYHADKKKTLAGKENGLFTDHFTDHVQGLGNEFWYTLLPNVYAMQLQSLYSSSDIERLNLGIKEPPGEPSFDELTQRSVDTFYRMEQFLKGGNSIPNFEFSGVGLENGTFVAWDQDCHDNRGANVNLPANSPSVKCVSKPPNAPAKYQPDAAGSFAILGVMAYDRWKNRKYLSMADESLRSLLAYNSNFNPVYEVQFSFAVMAAARMNRHYGYRYDISRFMQWAFSRSNKRNIDPSPSRMETWPSYTSNARPEVGIINESWGRFPVYGLWGGKSPWSEGGYAFYMNSIHQAITLAPVAKYYPQYATLFGKYLLHVASNAKAFFPIYMPNNQHPETLRKLQELMKSSPISTYHLLPYEGLKRDPVKGAIATGDAVDAKDNNQNPFPWGQTNLSLYSGSLTGLFSAILKKTDIPEIPLWDLNATDFQSPRALPTFLAYNPTNTRKTIKLQRKDFKSRYGISLAEGEYCALWDSVRHRWLKGTTADIAITLEPGQAGVFSIVPAGHVSKIEQGKVRVYGPSDSQTPVATIDYEMP